MNRWLVFLALLAVSCSPGHSSAMSRAEYRQQIRSTHILARPYRAGHFYGNTVRRRHHRQTTARPVRSQR